MSARGDDSRSTRSPASSLFHSSNCRPRKARGSLLQVKVHPAVAHPPILPAPDTADVVGAEDHHGGEGPTTTSGSDYTQTIQFISQLDPLYISLTVPLSPPTSPHTQSCSDGDTFHIH